MLSQKTAWTKFSAVLNTETAILEPPKHRLHLLSSCICDQSRTWCKLWGAVSDDFAHQIASKKLYSRASTNGHLSATATSLQWPLIFPSRRKIHTFALI